jgi:OOP family OmpA-OmpF porin
MQKVIVGLLVALLVAAAGTTHAGERAHAVSVSPFVGGYTFDGVQHLETAPQYGLRLGYDLTKNWGVELVGAYLATEGTRSDRTVNALSYGLDILYNFTPDGPVVPYLAVGGGGITVGHGSSFKGGSNTDATANAGLGLKYFLTDSVALRADARQLFIFEDHNSVMYNWQYNAGLTFLFGGKTPKPPAAPTSNLSVNPGSITKGESATLSWTSQNATNCDIKPGIGSVNPQGSMTITPAADTAYSLSCSGPGGTTNSAANISVVALPPKALPAPTSSLKVTPGAITKGDSATLNWTSANTTKCDMQPGIGPVQPQGSMPITPSADTVYTLTCAGEGGTTSSSGDIQVTVPVPPAAPKQEKVCIVLNIEFDTGKADIKPKYHEEIGKVAEFMKKYPEAHGVIEGHTDNVGGSAYNVKLSERRAASVRNYLVEKYGVAPERLSSKGYGYSKPVASNKTKEGRQKNRRIEATFDCVSIITK